MFVDNNEDKAYSRAKLDRRFSDPPSTGQNNRAADVRLIQALHGFVKSKSFIGFGEGWIGRSCLPPWIIGV